jgi:hypothetical protein
MISFDACLYCWRNDIGAARDDNTNDSASFVFCFEDNPRDCGTALGIEDMWLFWHNFCEWHLEVEFTKRSLLITGDRSRKRNVLEEGLE